MVYKEAGERDFTGSVSVRMTPCRAGPLLISGCVSLSKWGVPAAGTAWKGPQSACTCQASRVKYFFAPLRERDRKIVELYLRAWNTQDSIADAFGVEQSTVQRSIMQIGKSAETHKDFAPPPGYRLPPGYSPTRGDPRARFRSGRGPGFPTPPPRNPGGTVGGTVGSIAVPHAGTRTAVSTKVSTALIGRARDAVNLSILSRPCAGGDREGLAGVLKNLSRLTTYLLSKRSRRGAPRVNCHPRRSIGERTHHVPTQVPTPLLQASRERVGARARCGVHIGYRPPGGKNWRAGSPRGVVNFT